MSDFQSSFPKTSSILDATTAEGLQTGCQLYISVDGKVAADVGVGSVRPGVPVTRDSIYLWLSAGKPLGAVAIARLWELGLLDLDDPVAKHIPEFAARGKDRITIRHLLTHMAGIRWADFQFSMPWDEIIARICQAFPEPRWVPGHSAGYHAFTSWYLIGELVRRLDPARRTYDVFAREEIFEPLGMNDSWLTLTPRQYEQYGDRIGILEVVGEHHPRQMRLDMPDQAGYLVPGAGARGPMRELGQFYEMLLRRGRSAENQLLLMPQTVEALTARHRAGILDQTFKHVVDWGLGFILNSAHHGDQPYGFGPHASRRTFGHGGSQSSAGMADPEFRLVVSVVFNGMPGEKAHNRRIHAFLGAIYEDLGFAPK